MGSILRQVRRVDVYPTLEAAPLVAVRRLVNEVHNLTGHRPLSDLLWLDLAQGNGPGAACIVTWLQSRLTGYCQIAPGNDSWSIEVVVDPHADDDLSGITDDLVGAACSLIAERGGGEIHWWVLGPGTGADTVARHHGLRQGRTLHQMRTSLPLPVTATGNPLTDVRPFRPGSDENDWLDVNNAAFQAHPEQGGWTIDALRQRETEPWFDPNGFLLHHRADRLAAFCWTKVHHSSQPVLGEIYVIAVHPDFHGLGLGKALTVAGLSYLSAQGITTGMLYVDRDNTAAFHLYQGLGFTVHRTDQTFVGKVEGTTLFERASGSTPGRS